MEQNTEKGGQKEHKGRIRKETMKKKIQDS
jgi:hypothetical protein